MQPIEPIFTVELFPRLHTELITLLKGLTKEDWQRPTACTSWAVKDVAAHLLDSQVRRLSFQRDQLPLLPPDQPITNQSDLIDFMNRLNHEWIAATKRISPHLLIEFLDSTGQQLHQFLKTLDPHAPAFFSVAWAGDEVSQNWFDIAREYTEQWHHQQHIREAVGQPVLTEPDILYPVLDTFMRALSFTYQDIETADGTDIVFIVEGNAGGEWTIKTMSVPSAVSISW